MATEIVEGAPQLSVDKKPDSSKQPLSVEKQDSLATLALMAAMADRTLTLEERSALRKIMDGLSEERRAEIYQKVFRGKGSIEEELGQLNSEALRKKGYTLVNAICESDGTISKKERQFLIRLRTSMAFSSVLETHES